MWNVNQMLLWVYLVPKLYEDDIGYGNQLASSGLLIFVLSNKHMEQAGAEFGQAQ